MTVENLHTHTVVHGGKKKADGFRWFRMLPSAFFMVVILKLCVVYACYARVFFSMSVQRVHGKLMVCLLPYTCPVPCRRQGRFRKVRNEWLLWFLP